MGRDIESSTHVSNVEMDNHIVDEDLRHPHPFAPEPVAVRDPMHIAVDGPRMEKGIYNGKLGEDAQSGSENPTGREEREEG